VTTAFCEAVRVTDGAFEEGITDVRFLPAATPTAERMEAVRLSVLKWEFGRAGEYGATG